MDQDPIIKYGFNPLQVGLAGLGSAIGAPVGGVGGIVGGGLGYGLGSAIKNLYLNQSNQPTDPNMPYKDIANGAVGEMAGGLMGAGLNKASEALAPKLPQTLKDVLSKDFNGILRKEYHGSDQPIMEPKGGLANTTKGPDVFFTTPQRDISDSFAKLRSYQVGGHSMFEAGKSPEGYITPYNMARVNELQLHTPVPIQKANEIGTALGLSKDEITQSVLSSLEHGNIDADTLWSNFLARNRSGGLDENVNQIGKSMVDKLKNAGYRRMSINMDPGRAAKETVHFFPEEDLYPLGSSKLANLDYQQSIPKTQPIDPKMQRLKEALMKSLAAQAVQTKEGQ